MHNFTNNKNIINSEEIFMKKKILVFLSLLFVGHSVFAVSFVDAIQDLAVMAACKGVYSATEANGGWSGDPYDYYTPHNMATRFAKMSGRKTASDTFYGICFNYAEAAHDYIKEYISYYKEVGMYVDSIYGNQYFLALVYDDYNTITIADIGTKDNHTQISNGVYIRKVENGEQKVTSHDMATTHAWLWITRADGVDFWIDPTWTDNLGYVVYGYIKNGKEIQCRPNRNYCINYPEELNKLPLPPEMGERIDDYSSLANSEQKLKAWHQTEIFSEEFRLTHEQQPVKVLSGTVSIDTNSKHSTSTYIEFTIPEDRNHIKLDCVSDMGIYYARIVDSEADANAFTVGAKYSFFRPVGYNQGEGDGQNGELLKRYVAEYYISPGTYYLCIKGYSYKPGLFQTAPSNNVFIEIQANRL